jgi:hypothetical protein
MDGLSRPETRGVARAGITGWEVNFRVLQVATNDADEAQVQPSEDVSQIPPQGQKGESAMKHR